MKCYIRRYYKDEQEWGFGYLAGHYGFMNHWVMDKREAKQFESVKEARWFIKTYNLKNCEVEK